MRIIKPFSGYNHCSMLSYLSDHKAIRQNKSTKALQFNATQSTIHCNNQLFGCNIKLFWHLHMQDIIAMHARNIVKTKFWRSKIFGFDNYTLTHHQNEPCFVPVSIMLGRKYQSHQANYRVKGNKKMKYCGNLREHPDHYEVMILKWTFR